MDSITQGLLGAVIGQAGFRQRIGRETGWIAAGAAVLPDLDLLVGPVLTLTGIEHTSFDIFLMHRGVSHSLFLVPVAGLVIASLWWWFKQKPARGQQGDVKSERVSFWLLYCCVLAALFSAPLLDLFTSYGTQLFAPFSSRRYAFDAVPIIDIIFSGILIVTLVLCGLFHRRKKDSRKVTFLIGLAGLILSVLYIASGLCVREAVLRSAKNYLGRSGQLVVESQRNVEYGVYPQIPTIFVWRVTGFDGKRWVAGRVNVLFGLEMGRRVWNEAESADNEWTRKADEIEAVKMFKWFAMDRVRAEYFERDNRHIVEFHDMRYGARPESVESLWSLRVSFEPLSGLVDVEQVRHYRGGGFGDVAAEMWGDLWRP